MTDPIKLHDLAPAPGAKKDKTRVGRGEASKGKTAGRGTKGTKGRKQVSAAFEGGQMPLHLRLPKRGFTNIFATRYAIVNVADLNRFEDDAVVGLEELCASGLIKKTFDGIKVLGTGELTKKLTVKANAFSEAAKEKILAKGGNVEVI